MDPLNGEVADIQLAVDALALDVANNFCDTRVQAESLSTSFDYFDFRVSASFSPLQQLRLAGLVCVASSSSTSGCEFPTSASTTLALGCLQVSPSFNCFDLPLRFFVASSSPTSDLSFSSWLLPLKRL